jgi:hypothetical protein
MNVTGTQLKDAGMQLALFNEPDAWKAAFLAFAEKRLESLPFWKFEDLRADWLAAGNPAPHDHHVYAAIGQKVAKMGVYVKHVPAASPDTHAHKVALYRSLRFKEAA